jgi:hypothetical protein
MPAQAVAAVGIVLVVVAEQAAILGLAVKVLVKIVIQVQLEILDQAVLVDQELTVPQSRLADILTDTLVVVAAEQAYTDRAQMALEALVT